MLILSLSQVLSDLDMITPDILQKFHIKANLPRYHCRLETVNHFINEARAFNGTEVQHVES